MLLLFLASAHAVSLPLQFLHRGGRGVPAVEITHQMNPSSKPGGLFGQGEFGLTDRLGLEISLGNAHLAPLLRSRGVLEQDSLPASTRFWIRRLRPPGRDRPAASPAAPGRG